MRSLQVQGDMLSSSPESQLLDQIPLKQSSELSVQKHEAYSGGLVQTFSPWPSSQRWTKPELCATLACWATQGHLFKIGEQCMELEHMIWHIHVHEVSGASERQPGVERWGDRGLLASGQVPPFITLACALKYENETARWCCLILRNDMEEADGCSPIFQPP